MASAADSAAASSLGSRLKKYRKRAGISAEKLASEFKAIYGEGSISRDIITNVENGRKTDIAFSDIVQLAHVLKISPLALICDLEQPFLPADNPAFEGISNAAAARRFMAEFATPLLPGVMEKTSRIMWGTSLYWNKKSDLTSAVTQFSSYVNGKLDLGSEEDSNPYEDSPVGLENSCRQALKDIRIAKKHLESEGVIFTADEEEFISSSQIEISRLSNEARQKGLITESETQRYLSLFPPTYDADEDF